MKSICAALTLSLGLFTSAAQAVVLWDQPLASWDNGWCSPCTGDLDNYDLRVFGSFTLANDSILQNGSFAIHDVSLPGLDDLNISIWDVPFGTELFSVDAPGGSYTKVPNPDDALYYAVVDLPNLPLSAGSYWVSLFGTNDNHLGWGLDNISSDDDQYGFDGSVLNSDIYVGFSLSGLVVPEPGSLTLLGIGLMGLGFVRRRG